MIKERLKQCPICGVQSCRGCMCIDASVDGTGTRDYYGGPDDTRDPDLDRSNRYIGPDDVHSDID